jgi:hypothetical protein
MVVGLSDDQRIVAIVRYAAEQFQEGVATDARSAARISELHNVWF